jgi:sulfite exporter TauE/SafE
MLDPVSLLLAAAGAGLIGSLHCAVMCGPLALAADRPLAYLGGRFLGYAAIGGLMGFLGQHALCQLPVSTAQRVAVVLVAGFAAVRGLAVLRRRGVVSLGRRPRLNLMSRLYARLPRRGLGLGLATAILPCGMLLPAWALSASSGSVAWGAAVMLVFAAASLPGLVVPLVGQDVLRRLVARVPVALQGAAWLALALWIVLRGLLGHAHHHGM